MNVFELDNAKCSGCGLCASICEKQSIAIVPDEFGFLRPVVDKNTCVDCGLCVKKCVIANPLELVRPKKTYAAIRKDKQKLSLSSSGGVFAAFAEYVLEKERDWAVVGCALDETVSAKHIIINKVEDLQNLYGSKYVQSETIGIYEQVKYLLDDGKYILFSGTPCQVAAVQRYTKNHQNLLTIEVVCHGVANNEMFNSYLDLYRRDDIEKFYFRDKGQGWSFNNLIVYKNGKRKKINHRLSSYMTYYLKGETYRECCYECPYAKPERCADITIGDFWGILQARPDLNNKIDIEKGVSCVLINTKKGASMIGKSDLILFDVEYDAIRKENGPLNEPSNLTVRRNHVLALWGKRKKWEDVHEFWKKNDRKAFFYLWSMIPVSLQHKIRVMLGKR